MANLELTPILALRKGTFFAKNADFLMKILIPAKLRRRCYDDE